MTNTSNNLLWVLILFMTLISVTACESGKHGSIELRIMSFNIAAGYGNVNDIAEAIEKYNPDIVALQEVDVHWSERSDFQDQVLFLEAKLDMNSFFGEIYTYENDTGNDPPRQFGLAFLSKPAITHQKNHSLSRLSTQSEEAGIQLLPGFPEIVIEIDNTRIHLFNTHLDYRQDPSVRVAQIEEMMEIMKAAEGPVVLAGDLNARPEADELRPLFDLLKDVWEYKKDDPGFTFPSDQPDRRIDYILHSGHFEVSDAFTADTDASDHLPVVVDLLLLRHHRE